MSYEESPERGGVYTLSYDHPSSLFRSILNALGGRAKSSETPPSPPHLH